MCYFIHSLCLAQSTGAGSSKPAWVSVRAPFLKALLRWAHQSAGSAVCGTLARSGCMCRRALRSTRAPGDRAATTAAAELASCYRWAGVHAQNARACSPLAGPAFQPPTAQPWSFMLAKNPLPGLRALALANVLTVLKLSTLYSMCAQCV